jgi:ankyrin repeat protein
MLRLCLRSRVRHFLNELPDSLDETYEHVLKEIHKTNRGYVQRLLQCLAVAIRPLYIDELAEILNSDPEVIEGGVLTFDPDWESKDKEQELLSACPSLITIIDNGDSRIVQFAHFSVKEFLTSNRLSTSSEDISRYHIHPDAVHTTFARTSLGVLLRLGDDDDMFSATSIPLAEYAAEHWVSHAQVGSISSRVMGPMKTLFDSDKPHFAAWLRIYDIDGPSDVSNPFPIRDTPKPLYYSSLCGFYDLIEHLVKEYPQHLNALGGEDGYPLVAALHGGHIRVAELLFQHGANVDAQGRDKQTPLHRALEWPKNYAVGATRFLLKHGANVNAQREDLSTPLHLAAAREDFEVAQMILQGGGDNEKSLHRMPKRSFPRSEDNRVNLVQLLLEHGAEVNSQNERGATALHNASRVWNLAAARALVDHGANVNAKDNHGQTPLHRVSEEEDYLEEHRFGVSRLLIERRADVNARDRNHETPLHLASHFPDLKLVRMLLDRGANVNAEDNRCRTPLHWVLRVGNYSDGDAFGVAQLLIERGADVNARDECHETPLHWASHFPKLKLVRMLVDYGANISTVDNQGRTPLHRVLVAKDYTDEDRFGAAQLLVERGVDVNARDQDHETPLHLASYFPELKLVRMLLDRGANVKAEDNQARTPLHRVLAADDSSDEDRFEIAKLLIERGADVNARDKRQETPLHLASYFPKLQSARMLLDCGANVNAEDKQGRTPLHRVLEGERYSDDRRCEIAQLFVERGADVNVQDEDHETPLLLASHILECKLAQMLVDHGANINAEDNWGRTPLHRVLAADAYYNEDTDRFDLAKLLVERGADVNAQDKSHDTPLHLASFLREISLVRMFLDHGAIVKAEDNMGRTPLHRVWSHERASDHPDYFNVGKLLVEHGADVNAQDHGQETPLHWASRFPTVEMARMLVDHGANVNAHDNRGRTPLHRVPEAYYHYGCFEVLELLLERGADVNAPDNDHETPLHVASRHLSPDAARILLQHGADLNMETTEGKFPFQLVMESISDGLQRVSLDYSVSRQWVGTASTSRSTHGTSLRYLVSGQHQCNVLPGPCHALTLFDHDSPQIRLLKWIPAVSYLLSSQATRLMASTMACAEI